MRELGKNSRLRNHLDIKIFKEMNMIFLYVGLLLLVVENEGVALNFSDMKQDWNYTISTPIYTQQDSYGASVDLISGIYSLLNLYYLAFINSSANVFTVGILMNADPRSSSDTTKVVWEANRDDPVGVNATFTVAMDGNLALRDSDGRLVWSTNTANRGATNVDIEVTGNMVVYGQNDERLWQSFDHPSDSLMVSQVFSPGMRIVSRVSSFNSSLGRFSLVMEPNGLVLYSRLPSGIEEPYWVKSYLRMDELASALSSCGYLPSAHLNAGAISLNLLFNATKATSVSSTGICTGNVTERIQLKEGNEWEFNQSFIRLEADGNLRAYSLGIRGVWATSFELLPACSLPDKCKPFGVCTNGQCVECLGSDGAKTGWSDKCPGPRVESCKETASIDFVPLQGVEHFSSRYLLPGNRVTMEECRTQCLHNCSCSAFFFWNESGACFHTEQVTTLQTVSNSTHIAQLKVTRTEAAGKNLSKGAISAIVVVPIAATGLLALVFVIVWKKRRAPDYDSDTFLESLQDLKPMRFSYMDLEKVTRGFSVKLGTGGFGGVYEGVLPEGQKVAVKKLESSGQGKKEFYAEVAVLGSLHHWNLVKLLGFCSEGFQRLLVYEYMPNGSLDRWIFPDDSKSSVLSWKMRMDIMLGMARGLAYLHEECKQRIIHLDIKPQNVLLDESFVAKVADFGLSRLMGRDESFVVTNMRGTPGYLAPEWLLESAITEKSDVYSFGVVLLEVISGRKNFTRVNELETFYLPAWASELVGQGREMELLDPALSDVEESDAIRVTRIAFLCLQENGSARPSMGIVVRMLEGSCKVPLVIPSRQNMLFGTLSSEVSSSAGQSSSSYFTERDNSSLLPR